MDPQEAASQAAGTSSADRSRWLSEIADADELIDFLPRDYEVPNGVVLMSGTGIVPGDDFTPARGDEIAITIYGVGTLNDHVV